MPDLQQEVIRILESTRENENKLEGPELDAAQRQEILDEYRAKNQLLDDCIAWVKIQ